MSEEKRQDFYMNCETLYFCNVLKFKWYILKQGTGKSAPTISVNIDNIFAACSFPKAYVWRLHPTLQLGASFFGLSIFLSLYPSQQST